MGNEHSLHNVLGEVEGWGFSLPSWEPTCADFPLLDQRSRQPAQGEPPHTRPRLSPAKLVEVLDALSQHCHANCSLLKWKKKNPHKKGANAEPVRWNQSELHWVFIYKQISCTWTLYSDVLIFISDFNHRAMGNQSLFQAHEITSFPISMP